MSDSAQQPSFRPADAESALQGALALKDWWTGVENGTTPVDFFELVSSYPGAQAARGFFSEVLINGEKVPVMGHTGDYFFDQPQGAPGDVAANAANIANQAREFALGYWLRVQAWAEPQPYPELGRLQPPVLLRGLSMAPPRDPELSGMANRLRHYKLRETGEVGWFPRESAPAIIDLRELHSKYEWITIARSLLNFDLSLSFGTDQSLSISAPLNTVMHLVLNARLTVDQLAPEPGTLGVYGTGCAFMAPAGSSPPVAFGPDRLHPGLQMNTLRVLESGEVRLQTLTIMARPTRILSMSLDPNDWAVQAADRMSFGAASHLMKPVFEAFNKVSESSWGFDPASGARKFLNRMMGNETETVPEQEHFERQILLKQAVESRTSLLGTRLTWMQIPDWTDAAAIPDWVQKGEIL